MVTSDESGAAVDVSIAHSGLAEEFVVLEWLVDDGQLVDVGSPLVLIESEKTELELESPAAGRLEIVRPASDIEVPVGTVIGKIWTSG